MWRVGRVSLGWAVVFAAAMGWCNLLVGEDMCVEQEAQSPALMGQPAQSVKSKVLMSSDKVRVEVPVPMPLVQIIRFDRGKAYLLNERERSYLEMPVSRLEEAGQRAAGLTGQAAVKQTGATKRIGEWDCVEVLVTTSGGMMPMKAQIWVCKDIKVPAGLQGRFQKLQNRALGSAAEELTKIGGYPIQSNITFNIQGQSHCITTTVKKITYGPIPASMFEVPAGYTQKALPQPRPAPGQGGR